MVGETTAPSRPLSASRSKLCRPVSTGTQKSRQPYLSYFLKNREQKAASRKAGQGKGPQSMQWANRGSVKPEKHGLEILKQAVFGFDRHGCCPTFVIRRAEQKAVNKFIFQSKK